MIKYVELQGMTSWGISYIFLYNNITVAELRFLLIYIIFNIMYIIY